MNVKTIFLGCFFVIGLIISLLAQENIVNKWNIKAVEEFGEEYQPKPEQTNDWITFNEDKTFIGSFEGKEIKGNWSEKEGKTHVTASKDSEFKVNWMKVESLEEGRLSLRFQIPNLIKTIYILVPENSED